MISVWVMVLWLGGNNIEKIHYFSTKSDCEMAYVQLRHEMDMSPAHACIKVESIKEAP